MIWKKKTRLQLNWFQIHVQQDTKNSDIELVIGEIHEENTHEENNKFLHESR